MLLRVCLVLFIVIAPFQVLGPLGLREQGYGAAAWGWLQAVFSAGMIVGMLIAMRYRPRRPMITVTLTGGTAVAAPLAMAIFGDPWILGVVYGLRGVSVGILVAVWNTTLQTQIPRESLGRVTAWDWMSSLALWPVGLAVAGPLGAGVRRDHHVLGDRHPRPARGLLGAPGQGRLAAAAGADAGRRRRPSPPRPAAAPPGVPPQDEAGRSAARPASRAQVAERSRRLRFPLAYSRMSRMMPQAKTTVPQPCSPLNEFWAMAYAMVVHGTKIQPMNPQMNGRPMRLR